MPQTIALIVAAGQGARAGSGVPKQYRLLGDQPVLRWSLEAFARHPAIAGVHVVISNGDRRYYDAAAKDLASNPPITGGATRQESVRRGLEAVASAKPDRVLIHDAARPFVSSALIKRVAKALDGADASAPQLPVSDTLRRQETNGRLEILPRDGLFRAQTPQGFRFDAILEAHRHFADKSFTDDIALMEEAGRTIASVAGDEMNLKLTTPEDFALAERLAAGPGDVRTGMGFDAHRFGRGDRVWLCGVKIVHDKGVEGHSDADVGLHALTDAILGAIGAGDIGQHFPSSDPRWKAAPSHLFLKHAKDIVREHGGALTHVDVTVICEQPKIGPHRDSMRARIAEILGIEMSRVSVKATTTDGLGFTGRGEGIAAQAVATVRMRG